MQSCPHLTEQLMKKLGCHIRLHALQHVKLSLPDKLIRKVISHTWPDIFPASFNNLYCIHKFTDCTLSLSHSLSLTHLSLAQNGHQNNLLLFPGSSQQVCPCNLSFFYCKCTVPMPGSFFHLSQENESSKMLLSNAFCELCSALQWLALLRIL